MDSERALAEENSSGPSLNDFHKIEETVVDIL